MNNIWAPWRGQYVEAAKPAGGCIFCLPEGFRGADKTRLILYSDSMALVMMNLYPYNNGHLLVAPRRHVPTLELTTSAERLKLMDLCALSTKALTASLNAQGFNLGVNQGQVAGAGVADHLHFHVTPRWPGDVNYMASLAETRVISQHLEETYDRLSPYFN